MTPRYRADLVTWLALMALLALTCGSAYLPLGQVNVAINLGIALAKTLLVVLVFMRVGRGEAVIRLFAAAGFVWLAILAGLSFTDFGMRGW